MDRSKSLRVKSFELMIKAENYYAKKPKGMKEREKKWKSSSN